MQNTSSQSHPSDPAPASALAQRHAPDLLSSGSLPDSAPDDEDGDGDGFDVRKIIALVRANVVLIGTIIGVAITLAVIGTLLMTPRYTATTSVQIDDQSPQVLGKDQDASVQPNPPSQDTERFLQTQMDILDSRALAERVALRLHLIGDAGFYRDMGKRAPAGSLPFNVIRDKTVDYLLDAVDAKLGRNSRLATINFTTNSPGRSADIANAWAQEFIQANLQRRFDSSAYSRDFVQGQLVEAKAKLEQSERDLNKYAREKGLIRLQSNGPSSGASTDQQGTAIASLTQFSLLQLNSAANDAKSQRITAEQRLAGVNHGDAFSAPEVLANPSVAGLINDRAKLAAELQHERARHFEDHPAVKQLEQQLATLDRQVAAVAEDVRKSVKQQLDTARGAEARLNDQVKDLKQASLQEQDQLVEFNLLARDVDTNLSLYEDLLQRYKELNAAAGISASNISVIDTASPPAIPSSPDLVKNLLIGLLAGIAVAAGALILRYQFDDAVRVPEDIEGKLGLPLLGVIPKAAGTGLIDAIRDPKSPVSEGYNSLRGALLFSTVGGLPKSLLITSSQPAEGKSTTSLAIAQGLGRLGRRVVLIDVDLRRPAVHTIAGVSNARGMSSVLTGQVSLDEAIQPTDFENLSVITSGPIPPSPSELLSSAMMQATLTALAERFDVAIIDSPPVLGLADSPVMSALVDAVILVVQSDRGRRGSLKASLRRLRTMRPNIIGGVLTMFDAAKVGNRYSEYYGYSYYHYNTNPTATKS